ncbi:MAG: helix-turn-helix domain-containing protein [Acidobacteriota bacterium]|nr:helix-turn-helix domain-containing protein [Acidobacteriota bacterium]
MTIDAAACYRALSSRDPRFDGRFFTGVTTTGVYCRPICPARTPARTNVRFFLCAAAAEADGFRPCRRCRPDTAPGTPAWQGAPVTVARGLRLIRDGVLDEQGIDAFAARLGLGARQVRRLFETHVGATPSDIARLRRVHFARALLDDPSLRLADIAFAAGFQSVRQFNHAFRQTFKAAPRTLRGRGAAAASTGDTIEMRLSFRPPFDFGWLAGLLRGRAAPGVEQVDGGEYRRTVAFGDASGWIAVRRYDGRTGRPDALVITVSAGLGAQLMRVASGVRRVFDLDADPATIGRALSTERSMAALVKARPGLRIPGAWHPWEIALRAIVGQQVSVEAATTIVGRIVARAGAPIATPHAALTRLFPDPAAVAAADLSNIGMPGKRTDTVKRFASGLADGSIRLEITGTYEETVRSLCTITGIGPWTAEYIALRALGEPDAFPAGDLGLRKAMGHGAPAAERDVAAAAEAWRPWRGYAAMYLWSKG